MVVATELRLDRATQTLHVTFNDGSEAALAAEYLRIDSPSAEVQGHSPAERKLVSGKRAVRIVGIDRVGNYAVTLRFDDGHDSGIYSWDVLHRMAADHATRWPAYLAELQAAGRGRD